MSHVTTVDLEVRDLDAIADAARRLGLELVRDQKTYRWYGTSVGDTPLPAGFTAADLGKCDHVLRIPGDGRAYEIGLVRRRDGQPGWVLLWDSWNNGFGLVARVGENCAKLKQAYGTALVGREMQRRGFRVEERLLPNGQVQVIGRQL